MRLSRRGGLAVCAAAIGVGLVVGPVLGGTNAVVLVNCPPCLSVLNAYVRADVDPRGFWVEGTTGGDPGTALDDNKRLLYGFSGNGLGIVGTGFTTVRVVSPSGVFTDFVASDAARQFGLTSGGLCPPACSATCPPVCDAVLSVWDIPAPNASGMIAVTQTLQPSANPFTGRDDVIRFEYEATNDATVPMRVGVRALLDVRVGDNDGAPYIIPGLGALGTERTFQGEDVPSFWLAFESPTYASNLLRAVGLLDWQGLVRPDRFTVAKWGRIKETRWDYIVDTNEPVTNDSAVALYWEPLPLQPGQSRTVRGAYGVAGDRGGVAFLSSPLAVGCENFSVAFFVTNFELDPMTNGQATLALPPGFVLAPGEAISKPLGTIRPGSTASVVWELRPLPGTLGALELVADAVFETGQRLTARAELEVDCPAPPTPTPTATATAVPTATPTRTATPVPTLTPTARPSPTPGGPVPCRSLTGRVPPAAIAVALAQPDRVSGYNLLCNPNRPEAPHNHPRRSLTLRNGGSPYHPLHNPIVFKCGCP